MRTLLVHALHLEALMLEAQIMSFLCTGSRWLAGDLSSSQFRLATGTGELNSYFKNVANVFTKPPAASTEKRVAPTKLWMPPGASLVYGAWSSVGVTVSALLQQHPHRLTDKQTPVFTHGSDCLVI